MQHRGAVLSDAWPVEVQADIAAVRAAVEAVQSQTLAVQTAVEATRTAVEAVQDAIENVETVIEDRASGSIVLQLRNTPSGGALRWVPLSFVSNMYSSGSGENLYTSVQLQSGTTWYLAQSLQAVEVGLRARGVHFYPNVTLQPGSRAGWCHGVLAALRMLFRGRQHVTLLGGDSWT